MGGSISAHVSTATVRQEGGNFSFQQYKIDIVRVSHCFSFVKVCELLLLSLDVSRGWRVYRYCARKPGKYKPHFSKQIIPSLCLI